MTTSMRRGGIGTGNWRGRPLGLAMLALAVQGCSLHGLEAAVGVSTSIEGEIVIRGSEIGELTLRPQSCLSGDRGTFRGVDLPVPPFILRVAAEPIEGLAVALIDADTGERRGIFRRPDCRTLRGDVQRTGWQINHVDDVTGFVEVDCKSREGVQILGSIAFAHCH